MHLSSYKEHKIKKILLHTICNFRYTIQLVSIKFKYVVGLILLDELTLLSCCDLFVVVNKQDVTPTQNKTLHTKELTSFLRYYEYNKCSKVVDLQNSACDERPSPRYSPLPQQPLVNNNTLMESNTGVSESTCQH